MQKMQSSRMPLPHPDFPSPHPLSTAKTVIDYVFQGYSQIRCHKKHVSDDIEEFTKLSLGISAGKLNDALKVCVRGEPAFPARLGSSHH